eukprot:CAMPEP_0206048424 /NCGR_PEP_ID=MMETSP1466-20131121/24108_1 /ASSEMBLY_ACC=CAM_ASM_001126 /TAXON_ID=44452 /ORGANISM="Pavlova gyrans, Strain CCMP608" /LENGTH=195 /DNA_ID=CAMNT_0053423481 /DNA_START=18 /DNA_END=605 /DNA_ORIENTATION=+
MSSITVRRPSLAKAPPNAPAGPPPTRFPPPPSHVPGDFVGKLLLSDVNLRGNLLFGPQLASPKYWRAIAEHVQVIVKLTDEPYPSAVENCLREYDHVVVVSFPVPDFSIPRVEDVDKLVVKILKRLERGDHVYIHCREGKGRTGMILGAITARVHKVQGRKAVSLIQAANPGALDLGPQQAFVARYSSTFATAFA